MNKIPRIVVLGGGAGGLELVTRLGRSLGKKKLASILLIDRSTTHIWKPLLHEVATGTLYANEDELNYFVHASKNYYYFQRGLLDSIDRVKKQIILSPITDLNGEEITPTQIIPYDYLVIAIGSISNDLNIPGVKEYCFFLDRRTQADIFQQNLINNIYRLQNKLINELNIVIVGGGATGVELAAELTFMVNNVSSYGLTEIDAKRHLNIILIEAAARILSNLPSRISKLVTEQLQNSGVQVRAEERVQSVREGEILTSSGHAIKATMIIWAAGIKADAVTQKLDLPLNKINQIIVTDILQSTVDKNIFAIGDCSYFPIDNNSAIPPRAQAASQEAAHLAKNFKRLVKGQPLTPFHYNDYGSLISLGQKETFGSLMGKFAGSFLIEGKLARLVYLSLYKKHQAILYGKWRVFLLTIANILTRKMKPHIKLH